MKNCYKKYTNTKPKIPNSPMVNSLELSFQIIFLKIKPEIKIEKI